MTALTTDAIKTFHADIVSEYGEKTPAGTRTPEDITTVLQFLDMGMDDPTPARKASRLLRRLIAAHPFVDGNKRTALNAAAVLLALDSVCLQASTDLALVLKVLGVSEDLIEEDALAMYLQTQSKPLPSDVPTEDVQSIAAWHRAEYRTVYDYLEDN